MTDPLGAFARPSVGAPSSCSPGRRLARIVNKVIVAEITSTIRAIPQKVRLGRAEGLARDSVANLDNVHVVPKSALGDRLGRCQAPTRTLDVKRALGYALDWPELKVL